MRRVRLDLESGEAQSSGVLVELNGRFRPGSHPGRPSPWRKSTSGS